MEHVFDGVLELDNYADILPGILTFSGKLELTQYFVKDFQIQKSIVQKRVAVGVKVTLGRRLLGIFLTVYFPTILK